MRNTPIVFTLLTVLILLLQLVHSCQSNYDIKTMQYVTNGEKVYRMHCQNCHGVQGEGLGKLYPPLTDPDYLKDNRDLLPKIVRFGLKDTIMVSNEYYAEVMPPIPELTEIDIAYVLTYVTVRFGNSQEKYSQEEVKRSFAKKGNLP